MKYKELSNESIMKIAGEMEFDLGKVDPSQVPQTVPEWEAEQEQINAPPDMGELKAQLDKLYELISSLDARATAQETKLTDLYNQIGQVANPEKEQYINQFMQTMLDRVNKVEMSSASNDQFVQQLKTQLDQLGMSINMPSEFMKGVGQSSYEPSMSSGSGGRGVPYHQNVYNFNPPKPPRQRKNPPAKPKSKGFFGF